MASSPVLYHYNMPGNLLQTEKMSSLSVDWILEARVVSVQIRPVHQNLLTVVKVSDGFGEGNHVLEVARC